MGGLKMIEFKCEYAEEKPMGTLGLIEFTYCNKNKCMCNAFYSIKDDKWIC